MVPPAAGPRLRVVLAIHLVFIALHTTLFANLAWLMPMLVRLRFGAADADVRDWQTALITAAPPTFLVFSIFWNEVLRRLSLRAYLATWWLAAVLPLGAAALVQNYGQLLLCQFLAAAGNSGWTPLLGKLLKHLYPDSVRGRIYALVNAVTYAVGIAVVFAAGAWMERNPDAFRIYLPVAAVSQLAGVGLLLWLIRWTRTPDTPRRDAPWRLRTLLEPVLHMGSILRADRTFLRYERAFMTYGAAFMLCDALLPVLATTRLGMRYEDYSHSTQMILRLAMLAATLPLGWFNDRYGPVRTSGLAFAVLAFYPVLLALAGGPAGVGLASAVYGVGLAAVSMGWMLGPVALARTPDDVPHYVAIHTTLVGLRGIVFQGAGMLLYKLTGSFVWPLVIAAVAFTWAAWQMWRLHATTRRTAVVPAPAPPDPAAASLAD